MPTNNKLTAAKRAKNDEFFTRYEDIERELVNFGNTLLKILMLSA